MQVLDIRGKVAIVTGASSGFGRHFAKTLAARGAKVFAIARRLDALNSLVDEIQSVNGNAEAVQVDVSNWREVAALFRALDRIDIVVNNAGTSGKNFAIDCAEEEWRKTYDVNVHASFSIAQQAARKMIENESGGSIINIASITGIRPGISAAAYSSSKAAVIHMTKALAMEWARFDIRVNAIAPGYFETDLSRELLQSEFGKNMLKRIPQRRFGDLTDLDGPLLLLASDMSAYMTGSVIEVDGGHLASVL
jgi:NAD(P)-dependent dehydrogenase (short-subunit alcohol dehydrogenase family)